MGLFSKKNKKGDMVETPESPPETSVEPKMKSDKTIKPRAPKSMGLKLVGRVVFWIFIGFIVIKGFVSFAQGTRVIEKVTHIGSETTTIADSVKGFAADFAAEYFTWTLNNANDRIDRINKFIGGGIDQDAGLKTYDVKGSSRVLSVEVYNAEKIDEVHYDITVIIRREIQMAPDSGSTTPETPASSNQENRVMKKTYMVVPVTVGVKGPLIQSYPRFVPELQKGESDYTTYGDSITDTTMIKRSSELADSFLRSYFDGNVSQLKYFYADISAAPTSVTKSSFSIDKVDKVNIYQVDGGNGSPSYLRIEASVIVKSDIGESFTNLWILNAIDKEGRLYVISLGQSENAPSGISSPQTGSSTTDGTNEQRSPAPASTTQSTNE